MEAVIRLAFWLQVLGGGGSPIDPEEVRKLVEQLGSDRIEEREEAAEDLRRLGRLAVLPLIRAAGRPDAEVAARAGDVLERIPAEDRYEAVREGRDPDSIRGRLELMAYAVSIGHCAPVIREVQALVPREGGGGPLDPDQKRTLVKMLLRMGRRALEEKSRHDAQFAALYPQFFLREHLSPADDAELAEIEARVEAMPIYPGAPSSRTCEVLEARIRIPESPPPH